MVKRAELHHLLQYLQMHFKSSLRGLTGCEMSKMSNLIGLLLSKNSRICFQQSLTVSLHSSSPLAILIKKGEIWNRSSSEGGASFWGRETFSIPNLCCLWFLFFIVFITLGWLQCFCFKSFWYIGLIISVSIQYFFFFVPFPCNLVLLVNVMHFL